MSQPDTGTRSAPPDTSAGTESLPRRLWLIVLLGALAAIAPMTTDMYLPALPEMPADLSTGTMQIQLTLTANVVGLAAGQAIAGPLSDTFGRRRPLLIGMAAFAVVSLLCVFAPTVEALIALRLVQGATGAAGIVIGRAIVRDRYDGVAAAKFFAALMLVNGLAPILAPVVGGQLLRVVPWPGVFAVLSAFGALLLLGVLFGLRETLPRDARATGGVRATLGTFRGLLADRVFLGYALTLGLSFAAMFTYISGSSFVLQDIYDMSAQTYSLVFGANAVGIVVAGQVSGRLAGRVPLERILYAGLGIATAGGAALVAGALAGGGLAIVLPALFLVVAAQGLILPNATALGLSGRPPGVAGSASALLGVAQFGLGGAAAPLAGLGGSGTAVPMAVSIGALMVAAVLAAAVIARPRRVASQD
ncbi:multidrug effflux MFS transporter [Spirillospora sp. NPDC029432]|uniref:multidrug effflux MFS transporter n=1 Tax=Spirillospora sp. NPDC029432 TaxID=3154599 RepID=UPI0034511C40